MQIKNKSIFFVLLSLLLYLIIIPNIVSGQILTDESRQNLFSQEEHLRLKSGYASNTTVGNIIAMVIKGFLSVLGIIFVVLIVLAGYNWMTAEGNEEKVTKAKDTIRRAIIGLIITASAYAITIFVFSKL